MPDDEPEGSVLTFEQEEKRRRRWSYFFSAILMLVALAILFIFPNGLKGAAIIVGFWAMAVGFYGMIPGGDW